MATNNSSGLFWNHADWLGTERARTNTSGAVVETCTDTPYGMNLNCLGTDQSAIHFAGLMYDPETKQFHTLNRQYPAGLGRWLTADPAGKGAVHLDDPQTWNMYAYVRNNPTNLTDPTGLHDAPPALTCSDGQPGCVNGLVGAAQSSAEEGPTQKQRGVPAKQTYKTRDEAARAAEKAALAATDATGRRYEYGGWILKNSEGRYTYTIAVTFESSERFYFGSVTIPEGFAAVADYHTHPHNYSAEGEGLSAGDEQSAYGPPARVVYEADTYSRNMYRFVPGVSKYVPNEWCCGVIGDFVAHIPQ